MVQEVQTPVEATPINTLETIEAIWTSSRKIIIWRQTRDRPYGESKITLTLSLEPDLTPREETDDLRGDPVISDEAWEFTYTQIWDWIRIPLGGTYRLTVTTPSYRNNSSWSVYPTVKVRAWSRVIYKYYNEEHSIHTETVIVSLGRFDVLSLTIKCDNQSNAVHTIFSNASFTLEKL